MKSIFKTVGFLVFILFLGLLKPVISQNIKAIPDARLYQVYDKKYIDDLIKTNPDKIKYLNYFLDNSYYTVKLQNAPKPIEGIDIKILKQIDGKSGFTERTYSKNSFNILKFNFAFGELNAYTYIWKEAGIAIVLYPEKHIRENFNQLNR